MGGKGMKVAFDFDGVIATQEEWRGHDNIGHPIPQTLEVIKRLHHNGHKITIHTTRTNPIPFGPSGMVDPVAKSGDAKQILIQWLREQGVLDCIDHIAEHKPYADVYIDDRGVRFQDNMCAEELYYYILQNVPQHMRQANVIHTPRSKETENEATKPKTGNETKQVKGK